jgi:hypothetical protein
MKPAVRLLLFALLGLAVTGGCKKDELTSDPGARLEFSEDTILFDTVFTTVGSSTEYLLVYNPNDLGVNISSIRLATGPTSNFRLNVDGTPGKAFSNVFIDAHDSLWIFVEVTVDPNNANTPLVITDSILFETNGNLQDVDLVAWGQDAYFHRPDPGGPPLFFLDCNDVWNNDKPHVIYGYALVDSGCALTVNAGAQVHFHPGSGLIVLSRGTLNVNGTQADPVIIQGDRLGVSFSEDPGQWDFIRLSNITRRNLQGDLTDIGPGVLNCTINWAVIKNGNVGLVVDTSFDGTSPTLTMNGCIVQNMAGAALLGRGSVIRATNCLFTNCGQYLVQLVYGGDYRFMQCTFANDWSNSNRQTSSIYLNNYYTAVRPNNFYFGNCIVDGNLESEIEFDSANVAGSFNYLFDHCLLKLASGIPVTDPSHYAGIIRNYDPAFSDPDHNDYTLDSTSIAIDAGNPAVVGLSPLLQSDLNNNLRPQGSAPDLGAYERR